MVSIPLPRPVGGTELADLVIEAARQLDGWTAEVSTVSCYSSGSLERYDGVRRVVVRDDPPFWRRFLGLEQTFFCEIDLNRTYAALELVPEVFGLGYAQRHPPLDDPKYSVLRQRIGTFTDQLSRRLTGG